MRLTAYHEWLIKTCKRNKNLIIHTLKRDCNNNNPQAFDLLEATGDKEYTLETFAKAADLLLNNE